MSLKKISPDNIIDTSSFLFNTRGCVNIGSNCFMNCLIMSMFGYNQSPFYSIPPVNPNIEIIIKYLMDIIVKITNDKYPDISNLRNILPREMRRGQQDTTETFDLLMKILKFEPIKVKSNREYNHSNEDNTQKLHVSSSEESLSYISLGNSGNDNYNPINELFNPIQWDDFGIDTKNWAHGEFNVPTYRYSRSRMHSFSGNCLIFTLNRSIDSVRKHRNRIISPRTIKNGNGTYFRFAVILHLSSGMDYGHYITILSDKENNHFVYDDSSGKKIIDCKFDYDYSSNRELVERNSIMYFYYTA
jgi:hypothetical protein